MKNLLLLFAKIIAIIHDKLMDLNNSFETNFSDRELHFLVMGVVGLIMLFIVHPLFVWLTKKKLTLVISWIYVFSAMVVITFSIEIGQNLTNTGVMDFADIAFGMLGVLAVLVASGIVGIVVRLVKHLIKHKDKDEETQE